MLVLAVASCGGGSDSSSKMFSDDLPGGETDVPVTDNDPPDTPDVAPEFSSTPPTSVPLEGFYVYNIQVDDELAASLNYQLLLGPDGMVIDDDARQLIWDFSNAEPGTYDVTIQVSDPAGQHAFQTFAITVPEENVAPPNLPPLFETTPTPTVDEGSEFVYQFTAVDPEGGALTFALVEGPEGMTFNEDTRTLTWTPGYEDAGVHEFLLRATDAESDTTDQAAQITVNHVNRAPEFVALAPQETLEGTLYELVIEAIDPDGDDVEYFIVDAPLGSILTTDNANVTRLVWRPSYSESGEYDIELTVTDEVGLRDNLSFTLDVANNNRAPEITSIPEPTGEEGEMYFYSIGVSDPDGEELAYQILDGPEDAAILLDDETATFTWTPSFEDSGQVDISIRVVDESGAEARQSYTLTVADVNRAPSFTSEPEELAIIGEEYSYSLTAEDPDNDVLTFEIVSGPDNLLFSSQDRLVWTPTADELDTYDVVVRVRDQNGEETLQDFSIRVRALVNTYTVNWDAPETREFDEDLSSGDIAGYEIAYRKVGDERFTSIDVPDGSATQYQLPTLDDGSYEIKMSTYDDDGTYSELTDVVVVDID